MILSDSHELRKGGATPLRSPWRQVAYLRDPLYHRFLQKDIIFVIFLNILTSTMADSGYSKLKQDNDDSDLTAIYMPPAYNYSDPSSYLPGGTAGTNYLSVVHRNMKLVGSYTIDTTIKPPPLSRLFPQEGTSNTPEESASVPPTLGPNATFKTKKEDIELTLRVKGGKKAEIFVEKSQGNGHVWVDIVSLYTNQKHYLHTDCRSQAEREPGTPLHLKVIGSNTVKISLPSSFRGPIAGGSRKGQLQFSEAWRALGVTTFAIDQETPLSGKYFIGEWEGWTGDEWEGDRLVVTSEAGQIVIGTWEEKEIKKQPKPSSLGRIALDIEGAEVVQMSRFERVRRANWQVWVAVASVFIMTWRVMVALVKRH